MNCAGIHEFHTVSFWWIWTLFLIYQNKCSTFRYVFLFLSFRMGAYMAKGRCCQSVTVLLESSSTPELQDTGVKGASRTSMDNSSCPTNTHAGIIRKVKICLLLFCFRNLLCLIWNLELFWVNFLYIIVTEDERFAEVMSTLWCCFTSCYHSALLRMGKSIRFENWL